MSRSEETKTYASEGSRWYSRDGVSIESVLSRDGTPRSPTLRDARKSGWVPSTTTILQIMSKPQLDVWKMREVAKFCADAKIGPEEDKNEWAAWAVEQAKDQMAKARDQGSTIHGEIDRWLIDGCILEYASNPFVHAAVEALNSLGVSDHDYKVETPFCNYGIAGKVDLHARNVFSWIVDWKTTSQPLDDGKMPDYDEYCAQLASYSVGLFQSLQAKCINIFLSTSIPGNWAVKIWTPDELSRGMRIFEHCRELWKLKNRYDY